LTKHLQIHSKWLAIAILLLMFGLALTSMAQKAPTFDEQGFIVRGVGYLRGYPQIRVGHPLGLNILNASLLAGDETVQLPLDDPSWNGTSFHRPAELFLWEIGNDVEHIMFLSRLPTIWLGLLLAALAGRWAWHFSGQVWPGLLAALFVALDPNILAHTRLATTDLGLTAFALFAGFTLWRFLKEPSWRRAILAGITLGLLQNTKFTAVLFVPLFALVILVGLLRMWMTNRRTGTGTDLGQSTFPWRPLLMILILYPLVALFTLWAAYGFEIGTMPADLPLLPMLSGRTVPLAHHLEQLLDIGGRLQVGTPSFLLGQYSDRGWWYYFPAAFLLKTPLPTLLLLSWSAVISVLALIHYRKKGQMNLSMLDTAALLVPAVGYFAIALTTDINLGYRHILPVLPFAIVFATGMIARKGSSKSIRRSIIPASLLAVWLTAVSLIIYPDYLAYFNILAGGSQNGWKGLVDSNIDWGQDLDDLPGWMARNNVDQVWLSYFGEARPEYYGISYQGLDSYPPRLMNPQTRSFYPDDPAPGIYAISATNLQGVHFTNHDQFAWFREKEPLDKLGYSIFLYEVPARGEPVSLLLSDVQIDELHPQDFSNFGSNDIRPRWFDLSQSLIIPNGFPTWLVSDADMQTHPKIVPYLEGFENVEDNSAVYQLARYNAPELPEEMIAEFSLENGRIRLLEFEQSLAENSVLTLVTTWQQVEESQPLKIFIHIIDSEGKIIAQWDGLGAAWEGWQAGDGLIQVHELSLPQEMMGRNFTVVAGVYDPISGRRWLSDRNLDHVELE
jgi:hypothetical protein